jgi:rhodanese-related sulfurtransferase
MIDPVVGLDFARAHPELVVLADVRYYLDGRSGRAAYEGGHLPGAIFVDIDTDLAAHAGPAGGRHPLPSPEAFASRMAGLGLSDSNIVIAYDDAGGVMAARLVWMLRATGHDAALLDGGLDAYAEMLETSTPQRARGASRRGPGRASGSPTSTTPRAESSSCSTRASPSGSAASRSRSIRGPGTSRAPAACPAGRTSTVTGSSCRPAACGSASSRSVSPTARRSSPTAGRA